MILYFHFLLVSANVKRVVIFPRFERLTTDPRSAHLVPIKAVMADRKQHQPILLAIVHLLCGFLLKPRRGWTMSQVLNLEKSQFFRCSARLWDPVNHLRGK